VYCSLLLQDGKILIGGSFASYNGIPAKGIARLLSDDFIPSSLVHPADIQLPEWSISIGEVTAYGAAWRRGENWPIPPNPIPIDYVTRAAALWKAGEVYEVNPAYLPPLGWNPPDEIRGQGVDRTLSAAATSQSQAEGQIPSGYVPGEPIMVNLQVTPSATVRAYALEHQFPAGWQVSDISSGGELDAQNHKVKWGPFLEVTPRTVSYRVCPSSTVDQEVEFRGVASFDGSSLNITGSHQMRPSSRLTLASEKGTVAGRLLLRGAVGRSYRIEVSNDLITWELLKTITYAEGASEIADPDRHRFNRRFYRAILSEQ
jgi:hypothetical protein